jgi:hypothetical protein
MKHRGQAAVFIAILALVVGIVALVVIYSMNSRQNAELTNKVAQDITSRVSGTESLWAAMRVFLRKWEGLQ